MSLRRIGGRLSNWLMILYVCVLLLFRHAMPGNKALSGDIVCLVAARGPT